MDFEFLREKRPWGKREIDRLGEYFAGSASVPAEAAEMIIWHDELARRTAAACAGFAQELFGQENQSPDIVSAYRVKSQATIGDKIRRSNEDKTKKVQLGRMWDFAGARITANVLHDDLRHLSWELQQVLRAEGHRVIERDYIARAQPGGYRAIHLVVQSAAGNVELQMRTLLQSEWVNTFEKLADKTGRKIRYESDARPGNKELARVFDALVAIARDIHHMERQRAATRRSSSNSMKQLANIPMGLPLNSRLHELRAEAFRALSYSETATSQHASSILSLIESLRALSQRLSSYEVEE